MSAGTPFDWSWADVAVPARPVRVPGLRMAGFAYRAPASVDMAMIAHPSVTLLVELGEGIDYDAGGRRERGSVVVGLDPGALRATARRAGACLQIRLGPVAAAAVLGTRAELGLVPLADLWGREAERLEDRLRAGASWDERFAIATEAVGRRLEHRTVDPEVAHAWRRTLAARGRVRVDDLAGETGWSRKRLWSRFRSQLGISPKRAARLVRFDHAAHRLASGRGAAEVAAATGYADQSHLHREVKAFTGLTPTALARAPWLAIDDVAWPV
ncbi:helix-turn-helix domain-containing protein [Glycomyces sp. NPDC046736]|uniref:helix-turn-helix domain-containing protein n=1 Tax=Glycomyces sp. NPDC046736 TaxID=3155615 RepID=UPI003408DD5A